MKKWSSAGVIAIASCVVLSGACKKKETPAGTGSGGSAATGSAGSGATPVPPPPAGASTPLEGNLEGKPYKFTNARIDVAADRDRIMLSTGVLKCEEDAPEGDTTLAIFVGKGPGGKHFAPGPLAVDIELYNGKQEFAIGNELHGVLTLDGTEWKKGNTVKGTLAFNDTSKDKKTYTGKGSFEATVCDMTNENDLFPATPEKADAGPVSGTLGTDKFTFKSGVAMLGMDDERGIDRIYRIDLFDSVVDCQSASSAKGLRVGVGGTGGAEDKNVLVGTPQIRQASFMRPDGQVFVNGSTWVKFDALELKEGSDAKGSLYAEMSPAYLKGRPEAPAVKLSGTFTVKVCK